MEDLGRFLFALVQSAAHTCSGGSSREVCTCHRSFLSRAPCKCTEFPQGRSRSRPWQKSRRSHRRDRSCTPRNEGSCTSRGRTLHTSAQQSWTCKRIDLVTKKDNRIFISYYFYFLQPKESLLFLSFLSYNHRSFYHFSLW